MSKEDEVESDRAFEWHDPPVHGRIRYRSIHVPITDNDDGRTRETEPMTGEKMKTASSEKREGYVEELNQASHSVLSWVLPRDAEEPNLGTVFFAPTGRRSYWMADGQTTCCGMRLRRMPVR